MGHLRTSACKKRGFWNFGCMKWFLQPINKKQTAGVLDMRKGLKGSFPTPTLLESIHSKPKQKLWTIYPKRSLHLLYAMIRNNTKCFTHSGNQGGIEDCMCSTLWWPPCRPRPGGIFGGFLLWRFAGWLLQCIKNIDNVYIYICVFSRFFRSIPKNHSLYHR